MKRFTGPVFALAIWIFAATGAFAQADDKRALLFNMTSDGYPPFLIHPADGMPRGGIIHDTVATILDRLDHKLQPVWVPKKREIISLKLGKMDAMATALEWLRRPEDYLFSDPVMKVSNVLYSPVNRPVDFHKIKDLSGLTAITHLGYVYPPMAPHFRNGTIHRHDTTSETAMLKMVMAGRGDFTIINDLVGQWLIRKNSWQARFSRSAREVTYYDYRILFTRKWAGLVPGFNRELAGYIASGELNRNIRHYVGKHAPNRTVARY